MVASMWHILLELAPWLFVGVAIAGALHALLPADFIRRHLAGRWSVLKAALVGVPLPLCSCAVIPLGLSLKRQGATSGATVAFLISTPQTGVDSIMVSGAMLGLPFALFKMLSALVIGVVGGAVTDALAVEPGVEPLAPAAGHAPAPRSRWRIFVEHCLSLLHSIWRWLAIGIVVSAAITHFLPPEGLARFNLHGGLWAMLLAMLVGMPLYVCAVASVPIAAALVHAGFPPGAALVFLIAGPASNVATMGAVYRTLGRRAFIIYMATIAAGSLLFGWAFQKVIDFGGLDAADAHVHHADLAASPWAVSSAVVLLALMGWFAWGEVVAAVRRRGKVEPVGPLYQLGEVGSPGGDR